MNRFIYGYANISQYSKMSIIAKHPYLPVFVEFKYSVGISLFVFS